MLDDSDLDIPEQTPPPRRSGGRSFLVIAGTLGAIMLLSLVGMAVYALVILPQQQAEPPTLSDVQQTQTAIAGALQVTSTSTATVTFTVTSSPTTEPPSPTAETPSETPSETPLTPLFTDTFTASPDPATATVNALLTQAALAQTQAATPGAQTSTPSTSSTPSTTPSQLPDSGFIDDIGAPGLLAAAAILLLVIFATRRLRSAI